MRVLPSTERLAALLANMTSDATQSGGVPASSSGASRQQSILDVATTAVWKPTAGSRDPVELSLQRHAELSWNHALTQTNAELERGRSATDLGRLSTSCTPRRRIWPLVEVCCRADNLGMSAQNRFSKPLVNTLMRLISLVAPTDFPPASFAFRDGLLQRTWSSAQR